jgi:general secretory pathway protein F
LAKFKYKEIDSSGKVVQGTMEANSQSDVISAIKARGARPVSVVQDTSISSSLDIKIGKKKVKSRDLSIFAKQLYTMLHAGMPLLSCIETLGEQTEHPTLREALSFIHQDLQKGAIFSTSIQKRPDVFPPLFYSMVRSGELSGNLDRVLNNLAIHYQKEAKIQAQIKSAMTYPIIILIAAIGVTVLLIVKLVPMFKDMFNGRQLPGITVFILNLSDLLIHKWYIIIAAIFATVFVIRTYLSTATGRLQFDRRKLNLPIIGKYMKIIVSSRFASTLAVLITSGIPIIQAIESSAEITGNKFIEKKMENVLDNIKKGSPMSFELKKLKIFPPMMISMIKIGEESGAIDTMLSKTSEIFEEELEEAIKKMTSLMEPVIIILIGGIVAVVLLSIYLPMFEMSTGGGIS